MSSDQHCRRSAAGRMGMGVVAAAVALAIVAPAQAWPEGGRFELGLDVGAVYLGGERSDGTDGITQLRAGLFLTRRFELEGEWSRITTGVNADLDRLLLNAVFNFTPGERGQSYVLAGVGRADLDFEDFLPGDREERSSTVQVAAGRRFFLGPGSRLAARFEVSLWREQVLEAGSTVNAGVTGGLTWRSAVPRARRPGVVAGRAWIDEDGDGVDAEGREPSLPGAIVSISRDGAAAAAPVVTDERGRYELAPVEAGPYRLEFAVPDELRLAPGASPREVEVPGGGRVEVGLGALRREAVGLAVEARDGGVGGRVWVDRNGSGAYDPGEGLAGIGLHLTREGEAARAAISGGDGELFFADCLPGVYRVSLDDSPLLADYLVAPGVSPQTVEIPAPLGLTAAAVRDTVSGRVWLDADADGAEDDGEPGIAGARLRLARGDGATGAEAETGPDGRFRFQTTEAGTHRLTLLESEALRGIPIPPGTSPIDLELPARIGLLAGVTRDTILGRVGVDRDGDGRLRPGEPGLEGVTVRLSRAGRSPSERISRSNGTFDWPDRRPGTYQIEALEESLPPGHWIPPGAARRTVVVGPPVAMLAEGLEGRIEGRLWVDENRNREPDPEESGVAGAGVRVSRDGEEAGSATTGPSGGFGVSELEAGAHAVAVVDTSLPPGMWPDPATSPLEVEVLPERSGAITGAAWVDSEPDGRFDQSAERPLAGQTIALWVAGAPVDSVVSGALGGFGFADLEPGPYEVRLMYRPSGAPVALASPLVRSVEVARGAETDASLALATVELPPAPWLRWLVLIALALGTLVWLFSRWWKYGHMLAPCFRLWRIFRAGQRAELRRQIDAARRRGLPALEGLSESVGRICCADWDIATQYFLAHRGQQGWAQMHAIAAAMSPHLARKLMLRQQRAFALNRDGQGELAEKILEELRSRRGPSAETCGLLGRVHKDRWDAARRSGDADRAARELDKAIAVYRQGHEAAPSNPYPGINVLTLMEFTETPADERRSLREELREAVGQRTRADDEDYWAWATALELAIHERDETVARESVARAVGSTDERWQYETTLRNLRLIREAREARGDAVPAWVAEVEAVLAGAFEAGAG